MLTLTLLVLPLLALGAPAAPAAPADNAATIKADEKLVKDAGFDTDKAGLLDFFRKRSLTDAQRKECQALIEKLGSSVYEERKQASMDLSRRGSVIIPLLKDALSNQDAEIVRRAKQCLEQIDEANPATPLAAGRLLVQRAPDDAVPALLNYLPYAAGDQEIEDFLALLVETCAAPEKIHPALTAALGDKLPVRRAAAAFVLGQKGTPTDRDAVRKLLTEKDLLVRYRAAQGLLAAQDKAAIPALMTLLDEAPVNLAWQAEDILYGLAGETGPTVAVGPESEGTERRKCREAWATWWKENEAKVDLKRYLESDRLLGLTLGIEYNTGRVWECGHDKTLRWEIKGLKGPMEAQVLPNGLVLIAESTSQTVSVRDFQGNIRWEKKIEGGPTGCQRLPNGNTFISTVNTVVELNPKGDQVYLLRLEPTSNAIRKARNGHIIYATTNEIIEIDTAGKKIRSLPLPAEQAHWIGIQDLPGDRFLAANGNTGKVLELDATGKILWEADVPRACGVARLPNGHTLVGAANRVVELDEKKNPVWEMKSDGYVRRVHRR